MAKGYLVANIRVTNQDKFQEFSGMAGPAIKKYGGKVLARGPVADRLEGDVDGIVMMICLLYTSPSPRDATLSRMPSSA